MIYFLVNCTELIPINALNYYSGLFNLVQIYTSFTVYQIHLYENYYAQF